MSGFLVSSLVIRLESLSSWPVLAFTTVTSQSGQARSYSARMPFSAQRLVTGVSVTWRTSTFASAPESAITQSAASDCCLRGRGETASGGHCPRGPS